MDCQFKKDVVYELSQERQVTTEFLEVSFHQQIISSASTIIVIFMSLIIVNTKKVLKSEQLIEMSAISTKLVCIRSRRIHQPTMRCREDDRIVAD